MILSFSISNSCYKVIKYLIVNIIFCRIFVCFIEFVEKTKFLPGYKACCKDKCEIYTNPLDMVSLECCGDIPINRYDKICCKRNTIHDRKSGLKFYERCCDDKPYSYDQTCCINRVTIVFLVVN